MSDPIAPIRALFPAKRVDGIGYGIGDLLVVTDPQFVDGVREAWREWVRKRRDEKQSKEKSVSG